MAQQQQNFTAQFQGMSPIAMFGGVGRSLQAIATELTTMSQQQVEAGSKAMEKLREAKSLPDALAVQSDLVKAAFENFSEHAPRIAQIAASAPVEIVKGYQEAFGKMAAAGGEAADKASETTREMIDQTKNAAQGATSKVGEAARSMNR
jgi:hypothetical protein